MTKETKAEEKPAVVEAVKKPGFYIAEGKSVITLAGLKGPGEGPLLETWFNGGAETIKTLVESGHIESVS